MEKESTQLSFDREKPQADNEPVVCLGMTFKNDEERRDYFREELRKKLPELKKIEGFPIGEDDDIIALSDPPYYTACPNPWINEFIEEWEKEKVKKFDRELDEEYHREPFTADVSEGKNDPIYNAHSYHTKVPYKAIMRYLLHYTDPGDIVLDVFSGTGMTGVASNMCAEIEPIKSLGYKVKDKKVFNEEGNIFSRLGKRNVILNDLSPISSSISNSYNNYITPENFIHMANNIIDACEKELGWLYETLHTDNNGNKIFEKGSPIKGKINYIILSDVFICPNCSSEIVFWENAVDSTHNKVLKIFKCDNCGVDLSKRDMERALETNVDEFTKEIITQPKYKEVLINYTVGKKRYEKKPDKNDIKVMKKINKTQIDGWFPTNLIMNKGEKWGDTWRAGYHQGIKRIHHFYTKRNLIPLAKVFEKCNNNELKFLFTSTIVNLAKTARYKFKRSGNVPLSGTLYVSSLFVETNVFNAFRGKIKQISSMYKKLSKESKAVVNCGSATNISNIGSEFVDYLFIDPPFGSNLMYSELNSLWESWLKIYTNISSEAIVNKSQSKELDDYLELMTNSFKELYRILKPGRWMTVVFSNSQASVWNVIQESIQKAGFVIANVSALDKKQGSYKAVMSTIAVKQDLVISAYKPKRASIKKIKQNQNTKKSAWSFVTQHLGQLPKFLGNKGEAEGIPERTPRILFDRMVAYHVQNGLPVPISSAEFQTGVSERFPMRDGMVFLENQVAEYDKKRTLVKDFTQQSLFVSDENSAIEWIRQQLTKKPQTRQDIHPGFMKELQHIAKHEKLPELDNLLEENFLKYEGDEPVPNQILTKLRKNYKDIRGLNSNNPKVVEKAMYRWYVPDPNQQADLEKLRERTLLREFEGYLNELDGHKRKLRNFRTEAIRAGFKKAYSDKDFEKIIKVGERIPEKVILEDDKLLMFYENTRMRLGL